MFGCFSLTVAQYSSSTFALSEIVSAVCADTLPLLQDFAPEANVIPLIPHEVLQGYLLRVGLRRCLAGERHGLKPQFAALFVFPLQLLLFGQRRERHSVFCAVVSANISGYCLYTSVLT